MKRSSYEFHTCDVFTTTRFGGNPLAVFPDAEGLSEAQMSVIAKELNLSETSFVFPPADPAHTARVRIFTPGGELPFAGHPTVGTAFVLASTGRLAEGVEDIVFEEGVGPVPVHLNRCAGEGITCTLTAALRPSPGPAAASRAELAAMLGLSEDQVLEGAECWSCGVPFLVVPLDSPASLALARLDLSRWRALLSGYASQKVYPVAREGRAWRVRMFAPGIGVAEDPATGGAAAAFAGWLARRLPQGSEHHETLIRQGLEMGRPSEIALSFALDESGAHSVQVGGAAVMVSRGEMQVAD